MEETKDFITSVVVGKDVVPRIGLHQLEAMRQDLINVIKKSTEPKVGTLNIINNNSGFLFLSGCNRNFLFDRL